MILTYVLTKASPFSLNWGWLSLLGDSSKNSPSLVAPCSPSQLHLWIGLLTDLLLAFLIQEFEPSALEQGEVSIFGSQAAGRGVLCCLCIPLPPFYGFFEFNVSVLADVANEGPTICPEGVYSTTW